MPLLLAAVLLLPAPQPLKPYILKPGFSVSLPQRPSGGKDADAASWTYSTGPYMAAAFDLDSEFQSMSADMRAPKFLGGMTADWQILTYRDILIDGWPAVEMRHRDRNTNEIIWTTSVASSKRLYTLWVTYSEKKGLPAEAAKVQRSLSIKKWNGAGPAAHAGPSLKPVQSPDGSFGALMPANVKFRTETTSELGEEGTMVVGTGGFGYHHYWIASVDLPPKVRAEGETDAGLQDIVRGMARSFGRPLGIMQKDSHWITVDGVRRLSTELSSDRILAGRIDAFVRGGKLYSISLACPKPLLNSPQVQSVFKSFKVRE